MTRRHGISDGHWLRISHLLSGRVGDPGRTAADNRLFVNAVLRFFAAGPRGLTCPSGTAPASRSTSVTATGAVRESGSGPFKFRVLTRTMVPDAGIDGGLRPLSGRRL